MLWGIVTALIVNTGSLTNAVDFTIPTTISLNEATLNMPGSITVASSGTLQSSSGTIRLNGASGNYLRLMSASDGTQWRFDPQGTRDINYVDVKDSNNVNSTVISPANFTDSGNNTNWVVAPTPEPTPTGGGGGGGGGGGDTLTVN